MRYKAGVMHPRRFRKSRNWTLAEMAERIGAANGSTVSRQERGIIFPSPEYIEAWRSASDGKVQYEDWIDLRGAGQPQAEGKVI